MNTELNLIVNITEQLLTDLHKHNIKAESSRKSMIQRMNKLNNTDIEPIVSKTGRLHAPIDGYRLPENDEDWLKDHNMLVTETYAKGQFLPMTFNDEQYMVYKPNHKFKLEHKTRIKVPFYIAEHLMQYVPEFNIYEIGTGSSWEYKGVKQCYVYIKAFKKQYLNIFKNVIQDYMDSFKEEVPKNIKGVAPTGKVEVTGRVISKKDVETYNDGYNVSYSTKAMIVLENESTIYGTIPSKISDCEKGDIITFTATFTHAHDDNTHSFYKRPSKAKIVKRA